MTLLLDDSLVTAFLTVPVTEHWLEPTVPTEVRSSLRAADVGPGDVALLSAAEATLLTDTHALVSDVAVVLDGVGPIVMRTPVRPDGVEDAVIRLYDTGPTAEILIRSLLRPYFGITARAFVTSDESSEAAETSVVILDGAAGVDQPEAGFQEDLSKGWFVLTGQAVVSHVVVIGVEVLARGAEPELEALRALVAIGSERKRDVRSVMANRWEIEDREALGEMTNRQRFAMTAADRNSLATLIARGTWGTRFGKRLPAYIEALDADVRPSTGKRPMTTDLTPEIAQERMLAVLDAAGAEYKPFTHRPIRNFDDADLARQESGFVGTETKSMVITSGEDVLVYLTLIGKRVDMKALRARVGGPKPKFASDELLASRFAAEPGAAYPFGFDADVDVYVDPAVYGEEWVLMSAVLPTETLQIRGADLPKVFASLQNTVEEAVFNQE